MLDFLIDGLVGLLPWRVVMAVLALFLCLVAALLWMTL
jgi:hypothetical protein